MVPDRDTVDTLATPADIDAMGIATGTLSDEAVAFLGFQRTKQISKVSRKAWEAGDPAPLREEARDRRDAILKGALLEVYCEYLPFRDWLSAAGIAPASVIDIGCGQALPDLFLLRDHTPALTLIDIEETAEQYHMFADSGAGYASLDRARALLEENGAAPDKIIALNPRKTPGAMEGLSADLVTSFYSCGFHYPVDDYADLMVETINAGGAVCFDVRRKYLNRRPAALDRVLSAGSVDVIYDDARSQRIAVRGAP